MKEKIKHTIFLTAGLFIIVVGISMLLNNASYNPNFSVMDAISGATKRSKQVSKDKGNGTVSDWNYTKDDIALSGKEYKEVSITTKNSTYHLLKSKAKFSKKENIILLSSKENKTYQKAVKNVADDLKKQGYKVLIKQCSETMMLSLAHAGHFDLFLMKEEKSEKME